MNGKRLGTLLLAGSLGLNVALGAVIVSRAVTRSRESARFELDRSRRAGDQRGRYNWQSRYRTESDTARSFPRLEREQIDQLRDMRREMEEVITPLRDQIQSHQASIREELARPEPDFDLLDDITGEIAQLQAAIQQHSLRLILREREILTPEQFRSFIRMMMPGQYGPGKSGRSRHREPSDRDSTHGSNRDPHGS